MKALVFPLFLLFATASNATELAGWWLHINDRVAYERAQSEPANACQVVPMSAPVGRAEKGGPDVSDALKIDANGELFDCKSSDPNQCARYKDLRVDFGTDNVFSMTDPNCSGRFDTLPNGNLRYSGGCKGEYDQVELFHVTEEGYRSYVSIAKKCPPR